MIRKMPINYIKAFLKASFSVFFFFTLFFSFKSSALAATYYVATDGNDSYTTTQAQSPSTPWLTLNGAQGKATGGDTIHVAAGTYVETASGGLWVVSKAITWIADGEVIVRGTNVITMSIYGTGPTSITGFTIDSQDTYNYNVVFNSGAANITLSDMTFTGAITSIIDGIRGSDVTIENSTFTIGNNVHVISTGASNANTIIDGNTFNFTTCKRMFLRTADGGSVIFSNNTLSGATCNNPFFDIGYSGDFTLTGNTITTTGAVKSFLFTTAGSGAVTISDNNISLSTASTNDLIFFSAGIWAIDIDGNTITSTASDQLFSVINLQNQYSPIIRNNTIDILSTNSRSQIFIRSTGTDGGTLQISGNTLRSRNETIIVDVGPDTATAGSTKLNGAIIENNTIYGPVYFDPTKTTSGTHGIIFSQNVNGIIRYNTLIGLGMGIVVKGTGETYTSGGVYYNKIINSNATASIRIKGVKNVPVYNNSLYSNSTLTSRLVYITEYNSGETSTGTIVKNNILYCANCNPILIGNDGSEVGFVSDNNLFYRDTGTTIGVIAGTTYSNIGTWQAAGYGANSIFSNPLYSDKDNYSLTLLSGSPAINLGVDLGFIRDFANTSVSQGSLPDSGAYEFILPPVISSPLQYQSDGTTSIATGGITDETSVVLKFTMSSSNASDSLTPQVEVREVGTTFTDTVTNSGTAVTYSGTDVTGEVTVSGLTYGKTYHWQASVSNSAGTGSWTSFGGNLETATDFTRTESVSPTDLSISSPTGYVNSNTKPTLIFKKATDADSGMSSYSVNLDSGKNRSFSTTGIPASGDGSSSYTWKDDSDVKIEFKNEDDSDSGNDEIHVYFKGLDDGELTEGKHSWSVTGYDAVSNSMTQSTDLYIDRTIPSVNDLTIADVSSIADGVSYNLNITNRTPSFSGLAIDSYVGSTRANSDNTTDDFDKVSSGPETLTLAFKKLDNGQDSSSTDATYSDYLSEDYSLSDIQDSDSNKSSRFYITTPSPLVDGYYKVQLSIKDKAGNTFTHQDFYVSIYSSNTGGLLKKIFTKTLDVEITDQSTEPAETEEEKEEIKEEGYKVKVKVTDKDNNPVEGAKVTIHSKVQETTTNKDGIAEFSNVEKGEHKIFIAYNDYEGEQKINLTGDVKQFDLNLKVEPQNILLTTQGSILFGAMALIIAVLSVVLIKRKGKVVKK